MNADHVIESPNTQTVADRSDPSHQPGALRGEIWLTLHTYQAQQLLHGRERTPDRPAIIGLVGFADRLRVISQAARGDDPYADWWLIQVHDALQAIDDLIVDRQVGVTQQIEQTGAMFVTVASSGRPARTRLQFANPYAYRAARSLARFDNLVCSLATVTHIGLLASDTRHDIQQACGRQLRALFMLPQRYRLLKIDREIVQKKTGRSHEARLAMGDLPASILSGERRAPLSPRKIDLPTSRVTSDRSPSTLPSHSDADDEKPICD